MSNEMEEKFKVLRAELEKKLRERKVFSEQCKESLIKSEAMSEILISSVNPAERNMGFAMKTFFEYMRFLMENIDILYDWNTGQTLQISDVAIATSKLTDVVSMLAKSVSIAVPKLEKDVDKLKAEIKQSDELTTKTLTTVINTLEESKKREEAKKTSEELRYIG